MASLLVNEKDINLLEPRDGIITMLCSVSSESSLTPQEKGDRRKEDEQLDAEDCTVDALKALAPPLLQPAPPPTPTPSAKPVKKKFNGRYISNTPPPKVAPDGVLDPEPALSDDYAEAVRRQRVYNHRVMRSVQLRCIKQKAVAAAVAAGTLKPKSKAAVPKPVPVAASSVFDEWALPAPIATGSGLLPSKLGDVKSGDVKSAGAAAGTVTTVAGSGVWYASHDGRTSQAGAITSHDALANWVPTTIVTTVTTGAELPPRHTVDEVKRLHSDDTDSDSDNDDSAQRVYDDLQTAAVTSSASVAASASSAPPPQYTNIWPRSRSVNPRIVEHHVPAVVPASQPPPLWRSIWAPAETYTQQRELKKLSATRPPPPDFGTRFFMDYVTPIVEPNWSPLYDVRAVAQLIHATPPTRKGDTPARVFRDLQMNQMKWYRPSPWTLTTIGSTNSGAPDRAMVEYVEQNASCLLPIVVAATGGGAPVPEWKPNSSERMIDSYSTSKAAEAKQQAAKVAARQELKTPPSPPPQSVPAAKPAPVATATPLPPAPSVLATAAFTHTAPPPLLELRRSSDATKGRYWQAKGDIGAGTKLLVEVPLMSSPFSGELANPPQSSTDELARLVLNDKSLSEHLYHPKVMTFRKSPDPKTWTDMVWSRACGQVATNAFCAVLPTTAPPPTASGSGSLLPTSGGGAKQIQVLYPYASFFNHSCWPNAATYLRRTPFQHEAFAIRDIKAGEEVSIDYRADYLFLPTDLRQPKLKDGWGFVCSCSRCGTPQPNDKLLKGARAFPKTRLNELTTRFDAIIQFKVPPSSTTTTADATTAVSTDKKDGGAGAGHTFGTAPPAGWYDACESFFREFGAFLFPSHWRLHQLRDVYLPYAVSQIDSTALGTTPVQQQLQAVLELVRLHIDTNRLILPRLHSAKLKWFGLYQRLRMEQLANPAAAAAAADATAASATATTPAPATTPVVISGATPSAQIESELVGMDADCLTIFKLYPT